MKTLRYVVWMESLFIAFILIMIFVIAVHPLNSQSPVLLHYGLQAPSPVGVFRVWWGRGIDGTGSTSDCWSETQEEEEEQVKDPIVHQVCLSP